MTVARNMGVGCSEFYEKVPLVSLTSTPEETRQNLFDESLMWIKECNEEDALNYNQ